jgi:hypothetical protein
VGRMRFDLSIKQEEQLWEEWIIETPLNKNLSLYAKIDSGSSLTLVGYDNLRLIGILPKTILSGEYIHFRGVGDDRTYQALKVPVNSIPLGNKMIKTSCVYVPFVFEPGSQFIDYILRDEYLLGTDILNNDICQIGFKSSTKQKVVDTAWLDLTPHKLIVPTKAFKIYKIHNTVDED